MQRIQRISEHIYRIWYWILDPEWNVHKLGKWCTDVFEQNQTIGNVAGLEDSLENRVFMQCIRCYPDFEALQH